MNQYIIYAIFSMIVGFHFDTWAADSYGIFMVVKGDVKVETGGKTSTAKVGGKVQEGDVIRTGADSRAKVVMSDRNVISISPETTIRLAKYVADNNQKEVELELSAGKARANVEQKYQGEKDRFLMKTPSAVAGVRGTRFLMGFDPVTAMSSVVTFHGAVSFASYVDGRLSPPVTVIQGQTTSSVGGELPKPPSTIPKGELRKMESEAVKEAKYEEPKSNENGDRSPANENKQGEQKQGDNKKGPGDPNKNGPENGDFAGKPGLPNEGGRGREGMGPDGPPGPGSGMGGPAGPFAGPGSGFDGGMIKPGDLNLDRLVSDVSSVLPPPPPAAPRFDLPPTPLPPPRSDLIDGAVQVVNSSAIIRVNLNVIQ